MSAIEIYWKILFSLFFIGVFMGICGESPERWRRKDNYQLYHWYWCIGWLIALTSVVIMVISFIWTC